MNLISNDLPRNSTFSHSRVRVSDDVNTRRLSIDENTLRLQAIEGTLVALYFSYENNKFGWRWSQRVPKLGTVISKFDGENKNVQFEHRNAIGRDTNGVTESESCKTEPVVTIHDLGRRSTA